MSRINRCLRKRTDGGGRLTSAQELLLMAGIEFNGERPFASNEEHTSAWWAHRDALLGQCDPFVRPAAFWTVELDMPDPRRREQRGEILRRGLELRPDELALLRKEGQTEIAAPLSPPRKRPPATWPPAREKALLPKGETR
jgi:hypothetical protein